MKRLSFFAVILCALFLTVAISAQAGNGLVDIRKIDGLFGTSQVLAGQNVDVMARPGEPLFAQRNARLGGAHRRAVVIKLEHHSPPLKAPSSDRGAA